MRSVNEDVKKLPKWAQQLIQQLSADVEHYRVQAQGVSSGTTRIKQGYGMPISDERFFPEDTVRFQIGRYWWDVRLAGDGLSINGGTAKLGVLPRAENDLRIIAVET